MATNGVSHLDWTNFKNVINGKLTSTPKTRCSINPSTLEENPQVPVSTEKDVDDAVAAAKAAQIKWADVPVQERQKAVRDFAAALKKEKKGFTEQLVKEQGKPLMFAEWEFDASVQWLDTLASLDFPGEVVEETPEKKIITRYTPLGVAVGIVPWNFPLQLACGKIAPALVAGNSFILKPSPFTPYVDIKLVEFGQKFFPPGVFQVLSGDDHLGPWLTEHPDVDKISFTGSTATGKLVMKSASKTLKRVTLELGGNDPAIILPDVDIAAVAPKIATLAFLNSGQICIAIKRIYVHSSIYDEFLAAVIAHTKTLKVGDGFASDSFLGPINNEMQFKKVNGFLDEIEKSNLKVAHGERYKGKGYFVNPTIIDRPDEKSQIVTEEPFGPVVPMLSWDEEDDVIARANDTDMGLGASVWSKDLDKAAKIASKIKAGSVWVNDHVAPNPKVPFGGHKKSGIGAEWGKQGVLAYTNAQALYLAK